MSMAVIERTGEIGTAMALGVRRLGVLRQFVLEGLVLGFVGGMTGALLGWLLSLAISSVGIPMPPPPGMDQGFDAEILVTADLAFDAWFLAVVTTLLASLFPAWKASRMVIVDALRHQR
jgi:putative ABC transport system permease protein